LLRGDVFGLGLRAAEPVAALAALFAWRRAIARVPRTNFGDVTGELVARLCLAPELLFPVGLGGTAGGTVARFIGGE